MTVNDALFVDGLIEEYDTAVNRKDVKAITEILKKVHLNEAEIDAIINFEFRKE